MTKLNEVQITKVLDHLYPANKYATANQALINVFFNGWSIYKAEAQGDIAKNSLTKKVKRVRREIEFIESLLN